MNRRSFVKAGTIFAFGGSVFGRDLWPATYKAHPLAWPTLDDTQSQELRRELLALVNSERQSEGLGKLLSDDFAAAIATDHAQEMAEANFLSHWSRDGRKPYQRYSFAGGTEATQENDAAADHSLPFVAAEEFAFDIVDAHRAMIREKPPNDGHRKTILAPQHTHVGFGVAVKFGHVRLTEIYVARHVALGHYPRTSNPGSKFLFTGRLLDAALTLEMIDVYYESLPEPLSLEWLRVARPYGLPDERTTLRPKLPENVVYDDDSKGTIEFSRRGGFRVEVVLGKKPGIYTLVAWLQRGKIDKAFPATQVCVRVE